MDICKYVKRCGYKWCIDYECDIAKKFDSQESSRTEKPVEIQDYETANEVSPVNSGQRQTLLSAHPDSFCSQYKNCPKAEDKCFKSEYINNCRERKDYLLSLNEYSEDWY